MLLGLKPNEFHWKKQECANPSCGLRCSTFDNSISNTLDIFGVLVHQSAVKADVIVSADESRIDEGISCLQDKTSANLRFYSMYLDNCSFLPLSLPADQWRRSSPRMCSTKSVWSFTGKLATTISNRCWTTKNNKHNNSFDVSFFSNEKVVLVGYLDSFVIP